MNGRKSNNVNKTVKITMSGLDLQPRYAANQTQQAEALFSWRFNMLKIEDMQPSKPTKNQVMENKNLRSLLNL